MNLSTRPAVSIMRCSPVKNGWQLEQTSTLMFGFVEAVLCTAPQAHTIVDSTYLGCIPSFMEKPYLSAQRYA